VEDSRFKIEKTTVPFLGLRTHTKIVAQKTFIGRKNNEIAFQPSNLLSLPFPLRIKRRIFPWEKVRLMEILILSLKRKNLKIKLENNRETTVNTFPCAPP
jgi:hypothetical protein